MEYELNYSNSPFVEIVLKANRLACLSSVGRAEPSSQILIGYAKFLPESLAPKNQAQFSLLSRCDNSLSRQEGIEYALEGQCVV